jgi:hypothetical protein
MKEHRIIKLWQELMKEIKSTSSDELQSIMEDSLDSDIDFPIDLIDEEILHRQAQEEKQKRQLTSQQK